VWVKFCAALGKSDRASMIGGVVGNNKPDKDCLRQGKIIFSNRTFAAHSQNNTENG
jgi:hypothetical protein